MTCAHVASQRNQSNKSIIKLIKTVKTETFDCDWRKINKIFFETVNALKILNTCLIGSGTNP